MKIKSIIIIIYIKLYGWFTNRSNSLNSYAANKNDDGSNYSILHLDDRNLKSHLLQVGFKNDLKNAVIVLKQDLSFSFK